MEAIDGVTSGTPRGAGAPAVPPTAALTVSCTDLVCIFEDTSLPGSSAIATRSWSFGDGSAAADSGPASGTYRFVTAGTYEVSIAVKDVRGLAATASTTVQVTERVHAAYGGTTRKWSNSSGTTNYWSADVTVTAHSFDERPIAGATVTATWSGAVAKTVTGVTRCGGPLRAEVGNVELREINRHPQGDRGRSAEYRV
jgi:PKD repeat protein